MKMKASSDIPDEYKIAYCTNANNDKMGEGEIICSINYNYQVIFGPILISCCSLEPTNCILESINCALESSRDGTEPVKNQDGTEPSRLMVVPSRLSRYR